MPTDEVTTDQVDDDPDASARSWTKAESDAAFEELGDRLIIATRRFMRSNRRERIQSSLYTIGGHEFSRTQIEALEAIADEGEVRMNQLAARLGLDPSTVTRTVNPLVDNGLVDRYVDAANRRYVILRCTAAGKKSIAKVADQRRKAMREALMPMEPRRRLLLAELLDEYTTLMERIPAAGDDND